MSYLSFARDAKSRAAEQRSRTIKQLTAGKIWVFALGRFGYGLLPTMIGCWLLYFYQPEAAQVAMGQTVFVPQGPLIFGAIAIIGAVAAVGKVFDAIADPVFAALSDSCRSRFGRRTPFLLLSPLPICIAFVLVFWSPDDGASWLNAAFLLAAVILFYGLSSAYLTPYQAMIPELSSSKSAQALLSTATAVSYLLGVCLAYLAPLVWGALAEPLGRVNAIRVTMLVFAGVAFASMIIPALAVREKDYVQAKPVRTNVFSSVREVFKNSSFRKIVAADVFYWMAMSIFRAAVPFIVTVQLAMHETGASVFFVVVTLVSFLFYYPVNRLSLKCGNRLPLMLSYVLFAAACLACACLGIGDGAAMYVTIGLTVMLAAPAMAAFGVLRQSILVDVTREDAKRTGQNHEAMFYAAKTFVFKIGQAVSLAIFASLATIDESLFFNGYRIAALLCVVFCIAGLLCLVKYRDPSE